MIEWLVAADDRTGSLEVAAEFANIFGPTTVRSDVSGSDRWQVVDLASRHLDRDAAISRATAIGGVSATFSAHKIDSMLRGNWADELVARSTAANQRVLLIPSWPVLGRTCRSGRVFVDDVDVGRPADHIRKAGSLKISEINSPSGIERWSLSSNDIGVCNARTTDELIAVARVAAHVMSSNDVLLAGPSGAIGAVVQAMSPATTVATATMSLPVLVACGSMDGRAREQIELLRTHAGSDVEVVATPHRTVSTEHISSVAQDLVAQVNDWLARHSATGTLVIVGGDTAASLMGLGPWVVGGYMAAGMPWCTLPDAPDLLVVTKAGNFGSANALVELIHGSDSGS